MDKYEYNLKLDQIKALSAEEGYMSAAEIADSINWNKIKNVNTLVKIGEIYEKAERYQDARDILLMAYDRSPIGRIYTDWLRSPSRWGIMMLLQSIMMSLLR